MGTDENIVNIAKLWKNTLESQKEENRAKKKLFSFINLSETFNSYRTCTGP